MPDKIDFVLVTLTDPTAPEGTVQPSVCRLVQALHEDRPANLTVFASAHVAAIKGGPVLLLEKIPLDVTHASAPSYTHAHEEASPIVARATAATAAAPDRALPPDGQRRVFGKGQAGKHASSRSSAVRRFESASVASSKCTRAPSKSYGKSVHRRRSSLANSRRASS